MIEGEYTFTLNSQTIYAAKGYFVTIPAGAPHRYQSGSSGGQVLVTTPPGIETYFVHIATRLLHGPVPLDEEFDFARRHGQEFLGQEGHWEAAV